MEPVASECVCTKNHWMGCPISHFSFRLTCTLINSRRWLISLGPYYPHGRLGSNSRLLLAAQECWKRLLVLDQLSSWVVSGIFLEQHWILHNALKSRPLLAKRLVGSPEYFECHQNSSHLKWLTSIHKFSSRVLWECQMLQEEIDFGACTCIWAPGSLHVMR